MNKKASNGGPLFGLKVIEFEGIGPAPLAGQLLSDLGAEIIKVCRKVQEQKPSNILDRNKDVITLNLKDPLEKNLAIKIISKADVLIEGFRPGVMERLELGPEDCEKINPRLIYGRITGWGQSGPYSQKAGHDINYLAITGALHAIGMKDQPPTPPLNLLADYAGGTMFLIMGVLSALFERTYSNKGQVVDAAMVEGVPALMGLIHSYVANNQWKNKRGSNLLDGGCPYYSCYKTKDDKYISVGALENKFFRVLINKLGLSKTWITKQEVESKWPQLRSELVEIFKTKTRNEWGEFFQGTDACVEPVLSFEEVENNIQNKDRHTFFRANGVLQANIAPKFSRTSPNQPQKTNRSSKTLKDILKKW